MNAFKNFKSSAPEFNQLKAGRHDVMLNRFVLIDSRHNFDGSEKDDLPAYSDAVPQIATVFVAVDGSGVITDRHNGEGRKRYSELTAQEIKSGKFQDIDGYACIKNKDGSITRVEDPERTRKALSRISSMFGALGLPEGSGIEELNVAVQEKAVCNIEVVSEVYDDKTQYHIKSFKKAQKENAVSKASADLDDF